MIELENMGRRAKAAAQILATAGGKKNTALKACAEALVSRAEEILAANALDIENAKATGMLPAMIDRLRLTDARIQGMTQGLLEVVALPDPIGGAIGGIVHKNGLEITKVRVPLGVIGIIYESRPNVTADAAGLCLKAGNAVILRGGKEAINSNKAIADIMRQAVSSVGLPADSICLIEDTTRESSKALMELTQYLDCLIPRGGAGLIKAVVENARVPVIETGAGNCHVYVDASADICMAADIIFNAKTSRPSVCNAIESLVLHAEIAPLALPAIKKRLDEKAVVIRGDRRTAEILGESVQPATEEDWSAEYLDYMISVKVVNSIEEAVAHINRYSTSHSESIITKDYAAARYFTANIDSAAVYVNASTRFTDGGEFGLGAEIGISTQKLHARGPMGLTELTSTKYICLGNGQIRE